MDCSRAFGFRGRESSSDGRCLLCDTWKVTLDIFQDILAVCRGPMMILDVPKPFRFVCPVVQSVIATKVQLLIPARTLRKLPLLSRPHPAQVGKALHAFGNFIFEL